MVIIKLKGGLGNQMFQYAFGRRIALDNNLELKFDISGFKDDKVYRSKYCLNCFNIDENIANKRDLKKARLFNSKSNTGKLIRILNRIKPYHKRYILQEKRLFIFDPKVLRKFRDVYINGYWQNEKYFKNIEDVIRRDFTFNKDLYGKNLEIVKQIKNTNSVGIHLRNYALGHSGKTYYKDLSMYGIMSSEYYEKAVQYIEGIQRELHFFIFSDDINMAKRNIKIKNPTTFVSNSNNKDYEEMQLMSLCKHQIIANSTFSWWTAWLNNNPDKIVIAPKNWFNNADYDTSDLIPEEWIKL